MKKQYRYRTVNVEANRPRRTCWVEVASRRYVIDATLRAGSNIMARKLADKGCLRYPCYGTQSVNPQAVHGCRRRSA